MGRSTTLAGVMALLGKPGVTGGLYNHIRSRIRFYGISTDHFRMPRGPRPQRWRDSSEILRDLPDGFPRQETHVLRRTMIAVGILEVCALCGLGSTWNGSGLVLEIDHVDGCFRNNNQHNLRFLCPNCHSQQPTSKKPSKGKAPSPRVKMPHISKEKIVWPSDEDLRVMLSFHPASKVADELGISGPALKKRCKRRGIETRARGFWQKHTAGLV